MQINLKEKNSISFFSLFSLNLDFANNWEE